MITAGADCTMNWITVIWSMNAGACLTLAAFYAAVWSKQRSNRAYLLFSCSAVAAAVISGFELQMLNATTVAQYQFLILWIHVPVSDMDPEDQELILRHRRRVQ